MPSHFDIVIVGSGAGGATLAQRLAPTGKSILILERGEHLPREAENWDPKAVFIQRRYRTQERWYDKRGRPFTPNTHYWVGGNTTFNIMLEVLDVVSYHILKYAIKKLCYTLSDNPCRRKVVNFYIQLGTPVN